METAIYTQRVDESLRRVARWLEAFDPDELDYATTDGVVSLLFPDGARYVLNRQSAATQLWFAAGARAWHYNWDEASARWVDDRDGHALYDNIARVVTDKLGRKVAAP
jgi:CyaY protein